MSVVLFQEQTGNWLSRAIYVNIQLRVESLGCFCLRKSVPVLVPAPCISRYFCARALSVQTLFEAVVSSFSAIIQRNEIDVHLKEFK